MAEFTLEKLLVFVGVLFALLECFNLWVKAFQNMKSLGRPLREMSEALEATKEDLLRHQQEIDTLREGQRHMMRGIRALLNHELHDGNGEEMT